MADRAWRGDLHAVYLDPVHAAGVMAFIQERCDRALKRGTRNHPADPTAPWCELCTTDIPDEATVRLVAGHWEKAS